MADNWVRRATCRRGRTHCLGPRTVPLPLGQVRPIVMTTATSHSHTDLYPTVHQAVNGLTFFVVVWSHRNLYTTELDSTFDINRQMDCFMVSGVKL